MSLSNIKDSLDASKPISSQLLPVVDSGIMIAKGIDAVSKSVAGEDDNALEKYKPEITAMVSNAQQLVTKVNLILQQPGTVGSGPATPPTPQKTSDSAAVCRLSFLGTSEINVYAACRKLLLRMPSSRSIKLALTFKHLVTHTTLLPKNCSNNKSKLARRSRNSPALSCQPPA
jgi:hypothetical protein